MVNRKKKKRWQEKFKHISSLLKQTTELSVPTKRISDWAEKYLATCCL